MQKCLRTMQCQSVHVKYPQVVEIDQEPSTTIAIVLVVGLLRQYGRASSFFCVLKCQ